MVNLEAVIGNLIDLVENKYEYLKLLMEADTNKKQIRKTRYCIMHNNKYYEIDIYPFAKNTAICEIELNDENEKFELPEFIKIIKEVTNDKAFSNYNLSKSILAILTNPTIFQKRIIEKE